MKNSDTITIKNPWKILTIILFIIIILLIYMLYSPNNQYVNNSNSGGNVDGETAGKKAVEFLNTRSPETIEYISFTDLGNIYEITISYQNQNLPIYITKDGNYFIQTAIPIE